IVHSNVYARVMHLDKPFSVLALHLLFFIALPLLIAVSGSAGDLRAGLAKIDITPPEPVMLAGYASRKELSEGAHDSLFARAVAFENDHQHLVLVAIDNC